MTKHHKIIVTPFEENRSYPTIADHSRFTISIPEYTKFILQKFIVNIDIRTTFYGQTIVMKI